MLSKFPKTTQLGSSTGCWTPCLSVSCKGIPPGSPHVTYQGLEGILHHHTGWVKASGFLEKGGTHMDQCSARSEKTRSPRPPFSPQSGMLGHGPAALLGVQGQESKRANPVLLGAIP